jgi:hypothetical protein
VSSVTDSLPQFKLCTALQRPKQCSAALSRVSVQLQAKIVSSLNYVNASADAAEICYTRRQQRTHNVIVTQLALSEQHELVPQTTKIACMTSPTSAVAGLLTATKETRPLQPTQPAQLEVASDIYSLVTAELVLQPACRFSSRVGDEPSSTRLLNWSCKTTTLHKPSATSCQRSSFSVV